MKPGETMLAESSIILNAGRRTVEVEVQNTSDHTIFVSSHFPFFEVNRRLLFDRAQTWGMHLDIPAGDAVRWRPGEVKTVRLVAYGGRGVLQGFNGLTDGPTTPERLAAGLERLRLAGYGNRTQEG
jgi:urease beta subunit